MRGAAVLALTALAGCARPGAPVEPAILNGLTLGTVLANDADCRFSAEVDGPALLAVSHVRDRAVGLALVDGEPAELTGTITVEGDALPAGVQLEGDGVTVAVQPARLPGVPVGVAGVRRAAVMTVAETEGGSATLDGVWSCATGR